MLALLININRDPSKGSAASAQELHPFRELEPLTDAEKREALKESFAALKDGLFEGNTRVIAPFVPDNIATKRLTHGSSSNPNG